MMKKKNMKQNYDDLYCLVIGVVVLLSVLLLGCEEAKAPASELPETAAQGNVRPLGIRGLDAERTTAIRSVTSPLDTRTNIGFYVKIPVVTPGSSTLTYVWQGNVAGGYDTTNRWWTSLYENIWISNRDAVMTVYAPYSAAQPDNRMVLTAALPAADGSNDLMAGTMNVNSLTVERGINATLSHLYTCLQFTFVKNDNFATYEVRIKKLELLGTDMYATADYDPYTKQYSSSVPRADISLAIADVLVPTAAQVGPGGVSAAVVRALCIPMRQAFTADATLRVTVTSAQGTLTEKVLSVKIPKETFTAARPFAPGKQYNFTVKVSPTEEMELTAVEVADWETATTVNDDVLID